VAEAIPEGRGQHTRLNWIDSGNLVITWRDVTCGHTQRRGERGWERGKRMGRENTRLKEGDIA
jgi:hypothetical protein